MCVLRSPDVVSVVDVHGCETRGCRSIEGKKWRKFSIGLRRIPCISWEIAPVLTSNDQGANDTSTQFGRLVDENLGNEVEKSNGEGPHAKLVGTVS